MILKRINYFKIIFFIFILGCFFYCGTTQASDLININTANLEELDTLSGIGPSKAQAIIDYRTVTPFQVIEDIMNVSGIGQITFDKIKDLIIVGEFIQEEGPVQNEPDEEESSEISSSQSTSQPAINNPPLAYAGTDMTALINQEIIFDGSLSSDTNNDTLTYFWNFGDGATDTEQISKHTYLYPGQYIVSLQVSDGEFFDLDIITINIYNKSIIISEFLPNPEGKDQEGEWIELFNQSNQIANLSNWQLDDQEGGSSPFIFSINSLIGPNQFLVLRRPITKIALNNDNDQVRLIYPDGSLAAEISYLAEKKEGFSIAFDNNNYFWTKIPTPGSANIISSTNLDTKKENLSSNNPKPIIQQSQDAPDITVNTNLNQGQTFNASNPLSEPETCLLDSCSTEENPNPKQTDNVIGNYNNPENFTASLSKSTQSNQKSKLILYLSIIISGSLLLSWIIIQVRKSKKMKQLHAF